jgi:hypothetical protein
MKLLITIGPTNYLANDDQCSQLKEKDKVSRSKKGSSSAREAQEDERLGKIHRMEIYLIQFILESVCNFNFFYSHLLHVQK